jgi:hypothetical protein
LADVAAITIAKPTFAQWNSIAEPSSDFRTTNNERKINSEATNPIVTTSKVE